MNQIIKAGALVCALAMLEWNPAAVAEEKRLGDYIYVPAMSNPAGMGAISLRVEGVKSGENGEKETVEALAGAEFGVYVYSSEGKLTPWANPLLPSEPMRIRTGETETRFSLPQGTEFYLRQERAPEGYTFDSQTLIPVTDGEIVVQNKAQGRLNITVRDQRGEAIEGVRLTATDETGAQTERRNRVATSKEYGIDDRWKRTSGAALRPRGKLHRFGNRAAGGRSSGAKRQRERAGGACIRRERRL